MKERNQQERERRERDPKDRPSSSVPSPSVHSPVKIKNTFTEESKEAKKKEKENEERRKQECEEVQKIEIRRTRRLNEEKYRHHHLFVKRDQSETYLIGSCAEERGMSARQASSSSSPLLLPSDPSSSSCVNGQKFTGGGGCRSFNSPEISDNIGTLCAEEQLCHAAELSGGKTTDTIVRRTVPTNGRGATNPGLIEQTRATFTAPLILKRSKGQHLI